MKKLLSLLLIIGLTSCAALFNQTNEQLDFNSQPNGADVYVDGVKMGTTPLKLKLKNKKTYMVEFRKEGYESKNYMVNNSVGAGWIVLDVLSGVVPVIIDAATGSWYEFDEESVNMVLEAQK